MFITRTAIFLVAAAAVLRQPLCAAAEVEFDVSLWASRADLTAEYRRLIEEAIEQYRGDFPPDQIITTGIRTFYFDSSGRWSEPLRPPPELDGGYDPFPPEPLTLDRTLPRPDAYEPVLSLKLPNI